MTSARLDSILEFSKEIMDILRNPLDLLRAELAIEDYLERKSYVIQNLESHQRKSIIKNLMDSLKNEKSALTIERVIKFIFHHFGIESEIIAIFTQKVNFELQNHIIGIIGREKKGICIPELKNLFLESHEVLYNETNLFKNSSPIIKYNIERYYEINSVLPEVIEYNNYLNKYIENGRIKEDSVDLIKRNDFSFSRIKKKLMYRLIHKINLITECFIDLDSPELLKISRKLVKDLSATSISSSTLNFFEDFDFKFKKMTSLSLFYLGKYGTRKDALWLCTEFPHRDENFNFSLIYAMGGFKKNPENYGFLFKKLKEISAMDSYYFYATLSSMVKIGFIGVEEFILEQLKSKNTRKILLTTLFIPYIDFNIQTMEQITLNLLNCKQPLIIRQAFWIIYKKKIIKAIPQVMNFSFSDNEDVKTEAQNLLIKLGSASYLVMKKRINYYGNKRKKVILDLMKQNVEFNENLNEIWHKLQITQKKIN